jgi:hypothetical protein
MMRYYYYRYHSGVAALFIIVVVGASALLMAVGASMLGIGELSSGFVGGEGDRATAIADGCLEEALERIRYNPSILLAVLTASSPPYANGSCVLTATPSGSFISLTITASTGEYYKKFLATIDPAAEGNQLVNFVETSN